MAAALPEDALNRVRAVGGLTGAWQEVLGFDAPQFDANPSIAPDDLMTYVRGMAHAVDADIRKVADDLIKERGEVKK